MKKVKSNKSKDRILNFFVMLVILIIFSGLGLYFYLDHRKVRKHYEDCIEICKPNIALEIFSKEGCYCQNTETEKIDPKDSI